MMRLAQLANKRALSDSELKIAFDYGKDLMARRDFLKQMAVTAATIPAAGLLKPAFARQTKKLNEDPVIILGGGAAGLSAAYTLKKLGVPYCIIEATQRVGGRIFTREKATDDGQFVELGAELVDSGHSHLKEIAKELGVKIQDFRESDKDYNPELFFIDGIVYSEEQFVDALKPLLEKIEDARKEIYQGLTEEQIEQTYIQYSTAKDLPGAVKYDNISVQQFLDSCKGEVDTWVLKAVSVAYLCEFGRETEEQSALNLTEVIDTNIEDGFSLFGDSDEIQRVKGGNSQLMEALRKAVASDQDSARLRLGNKLEHIREHAGKILLDISVDGKTGRTVVNQVICTLPFSVLREVGGVNQLALSEVKKKSIHQFGYGTNSKSMMVFSQKLWRNGCRTSTGQKVPRSTGALYTDLSSQTFWETSRLQVGSKGILTNYLGGRAGQNADSRGATADTAIRDLNKIYAGIAESYTKVNHLMNWSKIPTVKGSYACTTLGQYTTLWGANGEPELNGKLLFAGEHTSMDFQGFMNGAIETGISAAKKTATLRGIKVAAKGGRSRA